MGFLLRMFVLVPALSCTTVSARAATHRLQGSAAVSASVMVPVGDFTDEDIAPVQAKLQALVDAGEKQVILKVNSNGGEVETGREFVSFLRDLKKDGVRVSCFIDHKAYSMGAFFLEAACDDRWIADDGSMMFHEASVMGGSGRAQDLRDEADALEKTNRTLASITAKRLGMAPAAYSAKVAKGNWWLTAEEAVAVHAVDAIVDTSTLPKTCVLVKPVTNGLDMIRKLLTP